MSDNEHTKRARLCATEILEEHPPTFPTTYEQIHRLVVIGYVSGAIDASYAAANIMAGNDLHSVKS